MLYIFVCLSVSLSVSLSVKINEWLNANKLSLNVVKTQHMFVGSVENLKRLRSMVFLNSKQIKRVHKAKSLGVAIDEKLTLSEHIDVIATKVSAANAGLRQAGCFVPCSVAVTMYNSLIKPSFNYCDTVWYVLCNTVRLTRLVQYC